MAGTRRSLSADGCWLPRRQNWEKLLQFSPKFFMRSPLNGALVLVVCTLLCAEPGSTAPLGPVDAWLQAQTNLHTWSADFVQTRSLKALTTPLTATGHVWFAAPGRFRWELLHPGHTIAVRAPQELLVIYPKLKRVEQYPLQSRHAGQWRDALALLEAGFPRDRAQLDAQYEILSQNLSNRVCQIALRPKSAAAGKLMPRIDIAFDTENLQLTGTELHFADGSSMRNEFKNSELNPQIDDQLFSPTIPDDYKRIEPLDQR
jgi:outer membrane lipoprotein-sorting protein